MFRWHICASECTNTTILDIDLIDIDLIDIDLLDIDFSLKDDVGSIT